MGLLDRFTGDEGPKVAFVGIDGVPGKVLRDGIERGFMPNIAEMAEEGTLVGMDSVVPPESSACWPAMTTGTYPTKTGVFGFQEREEGSYETYVPLSNHVHGKRVWDAVGDSDRRSVVLNVPVTFPPDDIEGTLVSGFLTPTVDDASADERVVDYLRSSDYRIDTDASLGHEDKHEFVEDAHETLDSREEAFHHFMEEDWSLFWGVIMATDRVNHFLYEDYENDDELSEEFVKFYERVDEVLGVIRERLDDDTTLIVAADHGFCTLDYEVDLNAWLREEGWQTIADGGDSLDDITDDTRVYSLIPGRFYVNLEGREPEGAVPEEEYEETLEELEDALHALEDPDGDAVVERVVRKDEIGEDADETAPDLVVIPTRGHDLKAGFDTDKGIFSKGARNGMHTFDDASLLIEGADVDTNGVDITDVAPTVLDLLEIDAGRMDGESMVR